jgi:hypothetical protein
MPEGNAGAVDVSGRSLIACARLGILEKNANIPKKWGAMSEAILLVGND